jgi:hypothetical protein
MKMAWLAASISLRVGGTVLVIFFLLYVECRCPIHKIFPTRGSKETVPGEMSPTLLTKEAGKNLQKTRL